MFPDQRILCGGVIEGDPFPLLGDMAAVARLPQFSFMPILPSMTFKTGLGGLPKLRGLMAFQTGRLPVTPDQSEPGLVVVEEDLLPSLRRMTALALAAQNPFMPILFLMAAKTGLRRLFDRRALMALQAGGLLMTADELELRLIVIEEDLLPRSGRVTVLALPAQNPFVFVFLLMTSDAGRRCRRKWTRRVTLLATNRLMLPLQKKPRFGMIEFDFLPTIGRVASLAGFPQTPLVLVLFHVAGETIARRFTIFMF